MRGTRWLLILTILAILGGLAATYRLQKEILASHSLPATAKMPVDLKSSAEDWIFGQTEGSHSTAVIYAHSAREVKDSGVVHLEGVRLEVFSKKDDTYDSIKCAQADVTQTDRKLYSDGPVDITLKIPRHGEPKKKPVTIHTTGLTYETNTNKAYTERAVSFVFEDGDGSAVGASYDPGAKQLRLWNQVEVNWKAPGPNTKPMKVQAGELTYQEGGGKIWLAPWAKLIRENAVVESESAVATLENGRIRAVDASKGHGTDTYPNRKLDYAADQLWVNLSPTGVVERVAGEPNAHLTNTSESSVTTMTSNRVELEFGAANGESVLRHVRAIGNSTAESKPLPMAGKTTPETRVLRSANIEMQMRADGKEIESVEVPMAGTLEFIPNQPVQRHRTLAGSHMWIAYGPDNRIQSFRTVDATTQSDPTPAEKAKNRQPGNTSSKNLTAAFDPKTNQMTRIEQWDGFVYKEGDRNATAAKAVLEQDQNLITLETGARMWDSTGSTFADHIRMDQKTGNFDAAGHVTSSRQPEKDNSSSEMLSGDEPLQAVADQMQSSNHNKQVNYQGNVMLWQGANRIRAQQVSIDRDKRRLTASGKVVTEFADDKDSNKDGDDPVKKGAPAAPRVFTIVHADQLVYTDEDRLAHYTGSAELWRPPLSVKSSEIRAYLAEEGADNRLQKAYADGHVTIVQKVPQRTRTGAAEHAEYYTGEERIVLKGGSPQLSDSLRGNISGSELTYFVNDERLVVNGAPQVPVKSRVRAKKNLPPPPPPK